MSEQYKHIGFSEITNPPCPYGVIHYNTQFVTHVNSSFCKDMCEFHKGVIYYPPDFVMGIVKCSKEFCKS